MNGYDIDGVITAGLIPGPQDIIVTGRSYEESAETIQMLRRRGIFNAVYFNPVSFHDKGLANSGRWKAKVICLFDLDKFYEDDPYQINVINDYIRNHGDRLVATEIVQVGNRKDDIREDMR